MGFDGNGAGFLTSINAPRLEGNSTLSVQVRIPFKIDFSTDCTKLTMYSPTQRHIYNTHLSKHTDRRQPDAHHRELVCAEGGGKRRRTSYSIFCLIIPCFLCVLPP